MRPRLRAIFLAATLATLVATPFLFAASGGRNESTSELQSTAFVSGSKLILFGKDVATVSREGKHGYLIEKTNESVTVNGITYVSVSTPRPLPAVSRYPELEREADVIQAAAQRLWGYRDAAKKRMRTTGFKSSLLEVDGSLKRAGDDFAMKVPEYDAEVSVHLYENQMSVTYNRTQLVYPIDRPVAVPKEEQDARRLELVFQTLARDLDGKRLIVMGNGYSISFPLQEESAVRASLAAIPARAKIERVDSAGDVQYAPMQVDGFNWPANVVADFVR